jgi:hypothetical protein
VFKKESEGGLLRLNWKQVEFFEAGAGGDGVTMPGKTRGPEPAGMAFGAKDSGSGSWLENLPFSDRLRQPDNHPAITTSAQRLTALRPCLATGLPLSCVRSN